MAQRKSLHTISTRTVSQLPIDVGNRCIKYVDTNGRFRSLKSCFHELEPFEGTPVLDDDSIHLIYDTSEGQKSVVIGQAAVDRLGTDTYEVNYKEEIVPELALAAFDFPTDEQPEDEEITVETLTISVPDIRKEELIRLIQSRLRGHHEIIRNGREVKVLVRNVEVQPEIQGGFRWSVYNGVITSKAINAAVDVGGRTCLVSIFDTQGGMLHQGTRVIPDGGTINLANRIALSLQGEWGIQGTPKESLIMDAIEDGSYIYGTTGVSFKPQFDRALEAWISSIDKGFRSTVRPWLSSLHEVTIVGGSAPLLRSWAEQFPGNRCKIAADFNPEIPPKFINLAGLILQ